MKKAKKIKKKLIAILCSMTLLSGILPALNVNASSGIVAFTDSENAVSESNASMNVTSKEYISESFEATAMSSNTIWKASDKYNGTKSGTELFDGLTLLFDAIYKASPTEIGDQSFEGYISSSDSGKFANGVATGTAFKYTATENGYLTAYVTKLGSADKAKTLYITEEGAESSDDSIASISGNATNEMLSAKVYAGKTYYIYVAGSKGSFSGIEFSQTAKPVWWKAKENVIAGVELMPGLSASENLTYKESAQEFDGQSFTACAAGSTNPSENGASGAALKYEATKDGVLTVYCKVGANKTLRINEADGTVVSEWTNEDIASDFSLLSADISAGKTYYAYVAGSKAEFYGVSFLENADFTDSSEQKIKVEKVTKNGNTISFNVENGEGVWLDTYIASYKNNALDFIYKSTNQVLDGQISFECENIPDDAKVFVWKNTLEPVYESCILYNE